MTSRLGRAQWRGQRAARDNAATVTGRVRTALKRPAERRRAAAQRGRQTAETRDRVRLMVSITAQDGAYRKGLLAAALLLSPEEAEIIADLEGHGLQVPKLRDSLHGGHVIIDNPDLYESWRFEQVSHLRRSSHHRDIDKKRWPDIGMRGVLVREKPGRCRRLAGGGSAGRPGHRGGVPAAGPDGARRPVDRDLTG